MFAIPGADVCNPLHVTTHYRDKTIYLYCNVTYDSTKNEATVFQRDETIRLYCNWRD